MNYENDVNSNVLVASNTGVKIYFWILIKQFKQKMQMMMYGRKNITKKVTNNEKP